MKSKIPLLIILIVFSYTPIDAKANDPCSFLSNVQANLETKKGILSTISSIYKKVHGLIETPYFIELSKDEKGVYFTRQPGFYFTLDCGASDLNKRRKKIGMFGVGDTFKPLRKRVFSNEVYYFGLRRSGLMSFVRAKDLRKMEKEKVYFFNRTAETIQFCTNKNNCSGIQKEFNARHHYAVASKRLYMDQINKETDCEIYNVSVFNGRSADPNKPEYRKAQLNYCQESHENGVFVNYKSKAEDELDKLNITGQYLLLSSKELKDKIPFLFTKKTCRSKKVIKKNSVISLGGSIGSGFDFNVVKLAADGEVKVAYDISDEEIFEADKQYLYQSYSATLHEKNKSPKKILNDIVVTQTCDESVPTKLNEIRINISPEEDEIIALDIQELDEIARDRFSGVWINASSSSRLKGRTWLIASVEQNMLWKEFVFDRVYRDLTNVVPDNADGGVLLDYADYYSSIFMATAFEFIPKERVKSVKIQGRF